MLLLRRCIPPARVFAPIRTFRSGTMASAGAPNGAQAVNSNPTASTGDSSTAAGSLTKSGAKKEAKRAQMLAQKAAKSSGPSPATKQKNNDKSNVEKDETKKEGKKAQKDSPSEAQQASYKPVPKGHKKDLSLEMASGYDPTAVEATWYDWWESSGFFKPRMGQDGKPLPAGTFVIAEPPPNITGALHTGHAMMLAIEDTLVRWQRMLGKTVLYCPGYDHASIATQSVVEKRVYKATGQTRHDLGREKLLAKIWEWKEEYQQRITLQTTRLGVSCDWSRVAFTMSPSLSKAVTEEFVRLHEEGIIYRANRLVSFCVFLKTTLSNIEVDNIEVTGRKLMNVPGYGDERIEFGVITSFSYPIEGSDEKITVATTRPETMLGDTAICVHPDDERYKHLHGKFATHPFIKDRRLPIVPDATVEKDFGTGAVKITPAHDPDDYRRGIEHDLEFINILNDDGTLNANVGPEFQGLKRFSARRIIIDRLKELGLYVEAKDNPMSIPVCSRSGDIVEPVMRPQWWMNCKDMAHEAVKRTRAGELLIRPQTAEDEWYRWLDNIQDWCISRQLWWGHRCPVYYVRIEGEPDHTSEDAYWVSGRTLADAEAKAAKQFAGKKYVLEQDEDVLDTWFSSGLWPFSIMGWPDKTSDLENFYPNSLLETGVDIIFFWVARMVMLGIKLTGKMPFKEVFCHPMVRDAHGRKMSKSLGNVVNPTDIIEGTSLDELYKQLLEGNLDPKELTKAKDSQKKDFPKGIPQCGADALRFTLCAYTHQAQSVNLEINRVEGYRHFCNKLWNATRFAMLKLQGDFVPNPTHLPSGKESLVERWVLDKLNVAAVNVNKHLESRNFMAATQAAYNFWLYELCDVYIEAMKPMTEENADPEVSKSAQNTLYTCLDQGLRLLSPFMPYVTEELWQRLPRRPNDDTPSICLAAFPVHETKMVDAQAAKEFDLLFEVVRAVRSLAGLYGLQTNLQACVLCTNAKEQSLVREQIPTISALIKGCSGLQVAAFDSEIPSGCISQILTSTVTVYLMVKGLINVEAEVSKIEKKKALAVSAIERINKQIAAPEYTTKIPQTVQDKNQEKLKDLEAEVEALQLSIGKLSSI